MTTETVCAHCGGTGWKIVERGGLSGAEPCECASANRAGWIKEHAGIPPTYASASFDNFQLPADNPVARDGLANVVLRVKGFVREFPPRDKPGLLLVGANGTGKTHLAVATLKELLDRGHSGIFFDYQTLLDQIRSGYDAAAGAADKEAYRSALDAEILLLDDLGSHRVTDWVEDTVTAILTHRCNYGKPLIATTNLLDPNITGPMVDYTDAAGVKVYRRNLADAIGARARSRLFEMCRVVRIPEMEDYRVRMRR